MKLAVLILLALLLFGCGTIPRRGVSEGGGFEKEIADADLKIETPLESGAAAPPSEDWTEVTQHPRVMIEVNEKVDKWIRYFTETERETFRIFLARGEAYREQIVKILRSAGVPEELAALTISIPFNDVTALSEAMQHDGGQVAAVILEPVPANMGVVLPEKNYLARIEELVHAHKALLIFDEVITGFRLSAGGLQQVFGMKPDLTCLGKILGGGFPLAAFGGRKDLMDHLAPKGPVYQAGTLSGNPAAVTAALWMLEQMEKKQPHAALNKRAGVFFKKLQRQITQRGLPVQLNATGSMFTLFFTSTPVTDYRSAKTSDTQRYARFFHSCLEQGLYLAPSQFEANFISTTHTAAHLEKALEIFLTALEAAV